MYLGNFNAKTDSKPIPLFNQLPFCPCEEPNHQMYTLNMICIEKACPKKGLICVMCNYENHRQHTAIPVKIFLDKYRESFYNFQLKQEKNDLKIETIDKINTETIIILRNFQSKITDEINNLQMIIRNFSEQEIREFNREEENLQDPLIKMIGIEGNNCSINIATNLITNIMGKINYKENETMDIENLKFSHPSNDKIIEKFEEIKKKAYTNQEIIAKTLDSELKNLHKVILQLEKHFGVNPIEKEKKSLPEAFSMIEKIENFNIKCEFKACCLFDEVLNDNNGLFGDSVVNLEFLITDPEDNRFKLFCVNNQDQQPFIEDLQIKHSIKYLEYSKKLHLLIGIDSEFNLFTIKFQKEPPFLVPNWTSHHYKDLFSKADINTQIVGNYLIVGVNTLIYILNITTEGIIETKVKIEINGVLEFLCQGNNENEVYFVWNQQNSLKKFVSILEVEKSIIKNQGMLDVNYQLKGFLYYKELGCYVLWGNEFKGNKEFLEIVQNSMREIFYLDKQLKFMKIDENTQKIYLFRRNNNLKIIKFIKNL